MRTLLLSVALTVLLAGCSPPAGQKSETPADGAPQVQACNEFAPNTARQIQIEEQGPVSTLTGDLRGGAVAPGVYDLTRAVRIGEATGWQGGRAVVLDVTENQAGVVTFNWAGAATGGEVDRWTANFSDTQPQARLSYTCGRMGDVGASFAADATTMQLRLPDGANGSLQLDFRRRG